MNIRYRVELSEAERAQLTVLLNSGKHAARKIKRAQILLAADAGISDEAIASGVSVGGSTVYRTKRRFVEGNLELALSEEKRQRGYDMCLQTVAPGCRRLDGGDAIFQHDMMRSLLELEACQPPSMQLCPGRPVVVAAVPQQKTGQLLAGLAQSAHRRLPRTDEITDRFVGLIRHPDRGQLTGTALLGKVARVSPVSLDPLARFSRYQRRSDHGAIVPLEAIVTLQVQ